MCSNALDDLLLQAHVAKSHKQYRTVWHMFSTTVLREHMEQWF